MDEKTWRRKICSRVRELRQRTGASQMEFAHKADLSFHTVGKIERAEVFPTLETLIRLSEAHGIPLDEFFSEAEKANTRKEKGIRDLTGILRGQSERNVEIAVGLVRFLLPRL